MHSLSEDVYDVFIIGAGISGIGCACHLTEKHPHKRWAILETRDDLGGTWDLFKYPGIRSDSDLYTFSYKFRPWSSPNAIASAEEIKAYLNDTVDHYGVRDRIYFGHRVLAADWQSHTALWTLLVDTPKGQVRVKSKWIFSATGYYDYDEGYRPKFPNQEVYRGEMIHPQLWPEDLDYTGKNVAVVGSGATAVTLIPELARHAAHVTQVQRTPSYVLSRPKKDPLAKLLSKIVPAPVVHSVTRWKNTRQQRLFYAFCQRFPGLARKMLTNGVRNQLPPTYDVDLHFNPPYDPWDQRLCAVPDGDYFKAVSRGAASIITGEMEQFTEDGILMKSGERLEADIVVLATGLKLKLFDGIPITVDEAPVSVPDCFVYRGSMLSGVPNFNFAIGYTNSSWTLKVDLVCEYFCDLISELEHSGAAICVPTDPSLTTQPRPLFDFQAGYVKRSAHLLPKQGDQFPWTMSSDYIVDSHEFTKKPTLGSELIVSPQPVVRAEAPV
ncbi:MAG: NAD(P)/FAD-dependent oxidoreductase [Pseudomonadota bacterium]